MPEIARNAHDMISGMTPQVRPGRYVFVSTNDAALGDRLAAAALSTFREDEGLSVLVAVEVAAEAGLAVDQPMRCITLNVYSALDGVGLTAAVSTALAEADIPCNMIAAMHHDHVFIPDALCEAAMQVLIHLQDAARTS